MIRDNVFGLAAVVAAMVSVGGALAIVEAQQPPDADKPAATTAKKAQANYQRSKGSAVPGAFPTTKGMGGSEMMMPSKWPVDDDPEMTELAQSEAVLAGEASELIGQYAESENAAERKRVAAELRQVLARQFEVQKQRRELELGRIEERVRRLREQIKKRNEARETIIDRRLAQLIDDAEGLGWTPPGGEAQRGGKAKAAPRGPSAGHGGTRP